MLKQHQSRADNYNKTKTEVSTLESTGKNSGTKFAPILVNKNIEIPKLFFFTDHWF